MAEKSWRIPLGARRRTRLGMGVMTIVAAAALGGVVVQAAETPPVTAPPLAPAGRSIPPVPATNYRGQRIEIDETGLLACAKNQIAWVLVNEKKPSAAATEFAIAAERARLSSVPRIKSATNTLVAARDGQGQLAAATSFLATCTALGFEY